VSVLGIDACDETPIKLAIKRDLEGDQRRLR
jgi:hypothetical protein